jgi:low affinity Fe/Cu permease
VESLSGIFAKIVSARFGKFVLFVLALLFIGALPIWPYSRRWGFVPAAIVAVMTLLVFVFVRLGRI